MPNSTSLVAGTIIRKSREMTTREDTHDRDHSTAISIPLLLCSSTLSPNVEASLMEPAFGLSLLVPQRFQKRVGRHWVKGLSEASALNYAH